MSKDRKAERDIGTARDQYFKSLKDYKKLAQSGLPEPGRPDRYPVVRSIEAFEDAVWNVQVSVNLNNSRSRYATALTELRSRRQDLPPRASPDAVSNCDELAEAMKAVETSCLRGLGLAAAFLGAGLVDVALEGELEELIDLYTRVGFVSNVTD